MKFIRHIILKSFSLWKLWGWKSKQVKLFSLWVINQFLDPIILLISYEFLLFFWRFTRETEGDLITIHYLQPPIVCTLKNLNRYNILRLEYWRFTTETEGELITIHYLQPRILCTLKNLNRYINIVFNEIVFASKEVICESNASKPFCSKSSTHLPRSS